MTLTYKIWPYNLLCQECSMAMSHISTILSVLKIKVESKNIFTAIDFKIDGLVCNFAHYYFYYSYCCQCHTYLHVASVIRIYMLTLSYVFTYWHCHTYLHVDTVIRIYMLTLSYIFTCWHCHTYLHVDTVICIYMLTLS